MSLKPVIEKLDDVDEAFRGEYKEHKAEGKTVYVLDIEGPIDPHPAAKALKDENGRRRIENTQLAAKVKKFEVLGDRDPTEILAELDKVEEYKLAAEGKLDDAKINGIVETRIKTKLAPLERELGTLRTTVAEKDKVIEGYTQKERTRMISGSVSKAAREMKVVDSAIEDVELYGDRLFEVQEDGSVVTKDGVGVTPGLTPKQWLEDMQAKRPHWFGTTQGGGAGGGKGGGAGGPNPWSSDTWNLTEQGNILRSDRARAERLAKAAGTTIGGPRPKAKAGA